jgi:hypothetical protein
MHQIQVDIVDTKRFQRAVNPLLHALVPRVVELGRQPDLLAGDAAVLDAAPDLSLVAVGQRRVNMAVAGAQGDLDRLLDLVGGGLPGPEPDGGDGGARVELVCFARGEAV